MTLTSVGDLAKSFALRRHQSDLKQALEKISTEATTGVTADLARTVRGDFGVIGSLHHSLSMLSAYKISTDEAATFVSATQTALESVETLASGGGSGLVLASMSTDDNLILNSGLDIKQRFESAVAALNTSVAGRTLLAGTRTDGPALAPAEDILAALRTATTGITSAAAFEAAVTAWFDDPLGFATVAYQGSATPLAPFQIGDGDQVQMTATANDPNLRNLLKGMALGALVGEGALQSDRTQQRELASAAGGQLLAASGGLAYLRAGIGAVEARIDEAATRNSAESASLQTAITAIIAVDPYEAATSLQQTQNQLETLFAITARLSNLRLTDYIR